MQTVAQIIESEKKRQRYQAKYNADPKHKAERSAYNKIRNFNMKLARQFMKNEITEAQMKERMRS